MKNEDLYLLLGPDYVPEGDYDVCLRNIDLYLTNDRDHYYILAYFEVLNGSFSGRKIKQLWTFRHEQVCRTNDRINNFLSKTAHEEIEVTNDSVCRLFDKIRDSLLNEKFVAKFIKNVDSRSELLYAEKALF